MITKGIVTKTSATTYTVKSFDSESESYDVDISIANFGCTCKDFEFRGGRILEQLRAMGGTPNEACYCKHIKAVRAYKETWESVDSVAQEMVGSWVLFNMGTWVIGEVIGASPAEQDGPEPEYDLEVRGRTGRTARIKKNANRAFLCCNREEAEAYLSELN